MFRLFYGPFNWPHGAERHTSLSDGVTRWVFEYEEIIDAIMFRVLFDGYRIYTRMFLFCTPEYGFLSLFGPSRLEGSQET